MRRDAAAFDQAIQAAATVDPSTLPIASPWSTSNLQRIVAEDVFGERLPINTRAAAMRIPAVARGRNLIVSSICRIPLRAGRPGATVDAPPVPVDRQPSWITSALDGTSPQLRLAWMVDDLIFYGWTCLWRDNQADGFPGHVSRIPFGEWTINADNQVEVRGTPVRDPRQVCLIPGLHEGILSFGVETLQDARTLYQVVRDRLSSPVPPIDLHQTGGKPLTNEEIDETIDRWVIARRAGRMVGFTSKDIEAKALDAGDANLMIEGRNAASLELARTIGVSAGLLDATVPKASLNYETATGRNQEFVDRDLSLYMTPISARLSLDDFTPHGQLTYFDLTDTVSPVPSPTGPALED